MKNINEIISKLLKDKSDNSDIIYDVDTKKFQSKTKTFEKKDSITDFFINDKTKGNIFNVFT
jgi:hypothetical protein